MFQGILICEVQPLNKCICNTGNYNSFFYTVDIFTTYELCSHSQHYTNTFPFADLVPITA